MPDVRVVVSRRPVSDADRSLGYEEIAGSTGKTV